MTRIVYIMWMLLLFLAVAACGDSASGNAGTPNQTEDEIMTETKYNQPRKDLGRSKSVLILSSSPRRGGNSEQLCLQFKKSAEEAGHHVEMLNINDYDIRFFDQRE